MTANRLLQKLLHINGTIINSFDLDETDRGDGRLTANVPWAPRNSCFTYDFAYSTAWMLKSGVNKTKVFERQRVDWDTVSQLVDRVWKDLSLHILNAIRLGVSNARVEAVNNKFKLLIRIAYGFRNRSTMISLIMLFYSNIEIPWMRKVS